MSNDVTLHNIFDISGISVPPQIHFISFELNVNTNNKLLEA